MRRRSPLVKWAERVLLFVVVAALAVYGGDWAVFALRGRPQGQVVVDRYMAVPLKGNKTEFDMEGSGPEVCARAIFSQGALQPCWYLERNRTAAEKL